MHFLRRGCSLFNQSRWRIHSFSVLDQLTTNPFETRQPHIKHQSLIITDELLPVEIIRVFLEMAGCEAHRMCEIPMSQGYPCITGTATGGGDPGHYLKRNMMPGQQVDFLSATPEDKRVTTFQPKNPLSLLRESQ